MHSLSRDIERARALSFDRLAKLAANVSNAPAAMIVRLSGNGPEFVGGFGLSKDGVTKALDHLSNFENCVSDILTFPVAGTSAAIENPLDASAIFCPRTKAVPIAFDTDDNRFATIVRIADCKIRQHVLLCLVRDTAADLNDKEREHLIDVAAVIYDELDRDAPAREYTLQSSAGSNVALRDEQSSLRSVLNSLFVFVGILELDGTLIEANDLLLRAASRDIADVRGKPFWEGHWWSFAEAAQDRLRNAVDRASTGEVVRYNTEMRIANGSLIAADFCLAPLRDPQGRITHIVASGADITRRRHAEVELSRMARIVDEAPFLIRSATRDGQLLYLNRHGRNVLGYAPDSDLANAEVSHHHPDWALCKLRDEGYPAACREGVWLGKAAIIDADGREVPTCHAIVAHRNPEGSVEYLSSIAIDISGEKAAEAALKESELRFRGTFENAAVGMAHIALDGRWLRVNERLLGILGYCRADLIQMTFQDVVYPDDRTCDLEMIQKVLEGEIPSFTIQKRFLRKDRTLVWLETTVSMQETSVHNEPYFISIIEDITNRKEYELRQRLLLAELNHRVKNTLAMIQSIANQTMRQSKDPSTFVTRFTGRIQSLSGAHDLLTAHTWDGADLAELLQSQVSLNGMIDQSRFKLSGPCVLLPPQVALNLALVIHELSNNAVQFGAFACENGVVEVSWSISDVSATNASMGEKHLSLNWKESGGPLVQLPCRSGFGAIILDRGLKLGLGGNYNLDWRPEGLAAQIEIPLPLSAFRNELFCT